VTREDAEALDLADPLARFRNAFDLPSGVVYLDGNSLGPPPLSAHERLERVSRREWGEGLVRSWNSAAWIEAPARVGGKIARLVGAKPHEVTVADATSVNLFKLAAGALSLRPGRTVLLSEQGGFPTDLYALQGLGALLGPGARLKTVAPEDLVAAIDEDTAAVVLTHIHYRSALRWDMAAVTAAAHAKGALMLWDLCHSAGAVAVDLNACQADLAVGCGYKYLNGGPGAPAFLYAAPRLHDSLRLPLTGWLGHAAPFDFAPSYRPAPGIARAVVGTPPILSLAALEIGVALMREAPMQALRAKSLRMTGLFIALMEQHCGEHGFRVLTPRDAARRGSQVSFAHPDGYAIMQALIEHGVIGDFRAPDVLRFGCAPLYLRYADVWDAVTVLREVMRDGIWRAARFGEKRAVT